jgi:hypothetical protein
MTTYTSQYPPAHDDTYVKATTYYSTFYPFNSTKPANSLTGNYISSWDSTSPTNQRFHIDLGSAKIITRIYYENSHNSGTFTDAGAKNFTFWGSDSATAFAQLTYAIDTNWTQLTTAASQFEIHVSADQADPKYIVVSNSTAYRYYACKFADNWGNAGQMMLRRIELQSGSGGEISFTPKIYVF